MSEKCEKLFDKMQYNTSEYALFSRSAMWATIGGLTGLIVGETIGAKVSEDYRLAGITLGLFVGTVSSIVPVVAVTRIKNACYRNGIKKEIKNENSELKYQDSVEYIIKRFEKEWQAEDKKRAY